MMPQRTSQAVFTIPAASLEEVMRHAHNDAPIEACGIITASGIVITMKNAAASETFFQFDADEYVQVYATIHDAGEHIGAYYHSHTKGPARPSQLDMQYAQPRVFYLIVATETETAVAYMLHDTALTEYPVHVVP